MTSRIYKAQRYGKLLVVRVGLGSDTLSPRTLRLLVDTGSSYTVLPVSILQALGSAPENAIRKVTIVAAGGLLEAPIVELPWLNCLGHRVKNFPVVALQLPANSFASGLLGMDFLDQFEVVINVRQGIITCAGGVNK
jgi:predicted aspartyl protease